MTGKMGPDGLAKILRQGEYLANKGLFIKNDPAKWLS